MKDELRSDYALPLERLWQESIAPPTEDMRAAFEVVLRATCEPILAVETRAQIQGAARAILDTDDFLRSTRERGSVLKSYDICEVFRFDLRVTTGVEAGPLVGIGHQVSLRREWNGVWSVMEIEFWMS